MKDKYGNKSISSTDTITYDVTPPTVTYSLQGGTYTGEQRVTVTPSDNLSGVGTWAVHLYKDGEMQTGSGQSSGDLRGQTSYTVTLSEGSSWIVYTQVYDNAGNIITQTPNNGEWYYQEYTINSKSALSNLQSTTSGDYLKTVADNDELLRYVGTVTDANERRLNNYICFGTNNESTCTGNKDTYMYRIIGITTENVNKNLGLLPYQLKIIKATSTISSDWANSDSDITWDAATLNSYLNNTFLSSINESWKNIISNPYWYIGDDYGSNGGYEKTTLSVGRYKVGLMYASDYYNSGAQNETNWLYIANGISGSTGFREWTMTRYGSMTYADDRWYYGARTVEHGALDRQFLYWLDKYPSRPVFYLIPNITLTGEGTESNPFIIHAS